MRGEYYLTNSPVSTLSHMTEVTSGLASTSQLRLRLPTPASRTWLVTLEMLTLGTSDTRRLHSEEHIEIVCVCSGWLNKS